MAFRTALHMPLQHLDRLAVSSSFPEWEGRMSLSNAETYARRARDAANHSEVGDSVKKAIDELIKEIKRLQTRVADLESEIRRLR